MIICVVIPFFATSVERQLNPTLTDELLILSDNTRTVRRVVAVSKEAAQLDIQPGMALRHAQTFVPELHVAPLNPPHYRNSIDRLLNVFATYSDQVEIAYKGWGVGDPKTLLGAQSAASPFNPFVAFIDIGTLNPRNLYAMGKMLQQSLEINRISAQIAIASNRFTAWVTAQATREGMVTFVNEGEETWALACHPVSLLPLDEKVQERLGWLGIRTLGDFAQLPSSSIRPQFGKPGQIAYRLTKGIDGTPIPKLTQVRELARTLKFDGEVGDRQVIDEALKKLAGELAVSLEKATQTARKLRLTLDLNSQGACELEVRLRRRTNTTPQFHNALKTLIDKAKITLPITELTVAAGDIVPLATQQLELFPAMRVVEDREAVLGDLVERYGPRFFKATIVDETALLTDEQAEFNPVEVA